MIELICFDLDGVVVSTQNTHYRALNMALGELAPGFEITEAEQSAAYSAIPTVRKLELLTRNKGLPVTLHRPIYDLKQKYVGEMIDDAVRRDERMVNLFRWIQSTYRLFVCSNAVRQSVERMVNAVGVGPYVDTVFSGQDVDNHKPHPEMYLKAMAVAGVAPKQTLVVEDAAAGLGAAFLSGAYVLHVMSPEEVTRERLMRFISGVKRGESCLS